MILFKIFINFAERDLANANHNEILKTLTNIYYKFFDYLQRSTDALLEFDSKTSKVNSLTSICLAISIKS